MTREELDAKAREAVKHQKNYEMAFTQIETILKGKQALVAEFDKEIDYQRSVKDTLATDIKKEKEQLLNSIEQRKIDVERREQSLSQKEHDHTTRKQFLDEEIGKTQHSFSQNEILKAELRNQKDKLTEIQNIIVNLLSQLK